MAPWAKTCTGFIGGENIGLPSTCHPRRTSEDEAGLRFGMFGEQDATHTYEQALADDWRRAAA
jgi:hypothetical protein